MKGKTHYVKTLCLDERNNVLGSCFHESEELGPVMAAAVLSNEQIRRKHNISVAEFHRIKEEIYKVKVLDALFRWPDGPRYDILMHLIATCR